MALEPEKQDISYQYGRLLAVFEKIEKDTYDNENRETTAIRMQAVFAKRPRYASRIIWEQLKKAYYPRLRASSKAYYDRLIGEIINEISECPGNAQESALQDTYLFGYYLQKNELYRSKTEETNQEEEVGCVLGEGQPAFSDGIPGSNIVIGTYRNKSNHAQFFS